MDYDTAAIRQQLETEGYAVLPGFLSADEIARLRGIVGGFFESGKGVVYNLGKTQPNAAIEVPDLAWLFADPRVTGFFRSVFGERGAFFTGHCDIHESIVSNWHRDTGGSGHPYFDESCFTEDCRVYKMAFYLQDHLDGHGLTLRPGSQRQDGNPVGAPLTLESRAGDAVVFDVRIYHRGREPTVTETAIQRTARLAARCLDKVGIRKAGVGQPEWTASARSTLDKLKGIQPRMSVFFTFGADNRFSRQFARTNMERQISQYADAELRYPAGLAEAIASQGLALFDPAEVKRTT